MEIDYQQLAKQFLEQLNGNANAISIEEFANEYISFVEKNRAAKTLEGVKLVIKHMLNYFPAIKRLDAIELRDAEKFIDAIRKNAPLGVYNYLRTLKAMFNKAIEWNYLRANPFLKVKLPKKQETKPTFINTEELEAILKKINKECIKHITEVSFYAGLRLGEATYLKWKSIDLKNDVITLGDESFNTKSRKSRVVPMHPRVKEILEGLKNEKKPQKENYVFGKTKNQPFTKDYISKQFKKACRDAGMDEAVHYHSTRHSTGSLLSQKGVSIYTIQKILGHSSPNVTQIYAHLQVDTLKEAINKIN